MTNPNPSRFRRRAITAAAIIATCVGAAGVASAAFGPTVTDSSTAAASALVGQTDTTTPSDDSTTDSTDDAPDDATTDDSDGRGDRSSSTEEALTGDVADKVTAAALAAVPGGTIERVETDDDGAAYEAHMTDANGNEVTVTFDEGFAVVEIQEGGRGGGRGGHGGGRGGHGRDGEEALTGDIATQVTAAAQAAVPGGTIDRVETDADGATYEAHMTDADGNEVTVTFDESFAVVEIQEGR
jgi:uncharacterized membrane protein YkoI